MTLFIVAYLGGVLTILSPCVLPVLPFIFSRADQPFARSGLPLLIGMVLTFAAVASLAAVGGGWAVQANQWGRVAALVLMAFFGLTLLFPTFGDRLMQPLVRIGERLSNSASRGATGSDAPGFGSSILLGVATGLLWAPCAGPILGLVLTAAALNGASAQTSLLLLTYAAGAATSLGSALLIGGRLFKAMKRSLGVGEWIRRGLGAALLAGVVVIALGVDTSVLSRIQLAGTSSIEQALVDKVSAPAARAPIVLATAASSTSLPVEAIAPSLAGVTRWLNSPPLTPEALRGHVVVVDFWTYSCINCLRSLPYVRAWAQKYRDQGLIVIGVHSPEFAFEKDVGNVGKAAKDLEIDYPIAIDNDFAVWRAFDNRFWPAHYFIDAQGRVRHHHFGEGEYDKSEQVIQQLLAEAGQTVANKTLVKVDAGGAEAASNYSVVKSPETYVGHQRADRFASAGGLAKDSSKRYRAASSLAFNDWDLAGQWTAASQRTTLNEAHGVLRYRFQARDLHLVLGISEGGKPVKFRVTLDGKAPGASHGADIDAAGNGIVDGHRLYQLIRQDDTAHDHLFAIEFLGAGVETYAFTFG